MTNKCYGVYDLNNNEVCLGVYDTMDLAMRSIGSTRHYFQRHQKDGKCVFIDRKGQATHEIVCVNLAEPQEVRVAA